MVDVDVICSEKSFELFLMVLNTFISLVLSIDKSCYSYLFGFRDEDTNDSFHLNYLDESRILFPRMISYTTFLFNLPLFHNSVTVISLLCLLISFLLLLI